MMYAYTISLKPLSQVIEYLTQEDESLTQITEEPRARVVESLTQISESQTQVVEPLARVFPRLCNHAPMHYAPKNL
jgi:hypothetical protein